MITIMLDDIYTYLEEIPFREQYFATNEMIVDQGDQVVSLFAVQSGLVHLVRFQEDGGMVILQRAGAGAILAEASVFSEAYHCAAVAVRPSVLRVYPLESVQRLLESSAGAALAYARHIADETRRARKRAEILALKTVSERLSAWLTWNHGLLPKRGAWHHVADEIGISKEALYRELSKRRKERD